MGTRPEDSGDTHEPAQEEAEREADTGELTITSLRPDAGSASGQLRRVGWRRWYRLGGTALLVTLVIAFALALALPRLPRPVAPKPPPDPLTLNVDASGESCVDGVAWSPNGARLAVLGGTGCVSQTQGGDRSEKIVLYDVKTGRQTWGETFGGTVLTQIVPPSLRQDVNALSQVVIGYSAPLWSPDGRSIALSFNAYQAYAPGQNGEPKQYGWGLVVLTLATGSVRLIEGPSIISVAGGAGQPGLTEPYPVGRWDLRTGTFDEQTLAPGLAYTWTAQDELVPTQPLPLGARTGAAQAVGASPVGNPLGGRNFTLWQSGSVNYAPANGCPQQNGSNSSSPTPYNPGDYYLIFIGTPVWSPDGRYLLWYAGTQGRLLITPAAPAPSPTPIPPFQASSYGCSNFGPASKYPLVPVHDAGLKAALGQIVLNTQPSIQMAWRPDGKVLAVGPGDTTSGEPALTLYACATGRVLRQFSVAQFDRWALLNGQIGGGPFAAMAWSPDGARLALVPWGSNPEVLVLGTATLGS